MKRALRLAARALRQCAYPIPFLARRYIRTVAAGVAPAVARRIRCLDIGAGVAPYRADIERRFDVEIYVAYDIAPSDATTVVGDATRLPFRSESMDLIVSMDTLQHIPSVDRVFDEIARVLRPGGIVLLSFPFTYGECDVADLYRWSLHGMTHELTRRGMEIVDVRRRGGALFAVACALQWAIQHAIPGGRTSWRREMTAVSLLRSAVVQVLTLPTAVLGWIALGIDRLLPASGLYMGGLILARRVREAA